MSYEDYSDVKRNKPVKWWHEAIIDDMLAFPLDTLAERGDRLGYSPAYLSVIINSDMFKAAYTQRREEYGELLDGSIAHKQAHAADRALSLILEQMEKKRTDIPFSQLTDFAHKSLASLGYSGQRGPSTVVDNRTIVVGAGVTKEDLAAARSKIRGIEAQKIEDQREVEEGPDPLDVDSMEVVDAARVDGDATVE